MPSMHHLLPPPNSNKCLVSIARANGWRCYAWPARSRRKFVIFGNLTLTGKITLPRSVWEANDFLRLLLWIFALKSRK
jgi:hypothetical protein